MGTNEGRGLKAGDIVQFLNPKFPLMHKSLVEVVEALEKELVVEQFDGWFVVPYKCVHKVCDGGHNPCE